MRDARGNEAPAALNARVVFNDPGPMTEAAIQGQGVAMLAMPDILPHLESGALVRLLPRWYADAGSIALYYSTRMSLPAKTRVFIDHVIEEFQYHRYAERFAGSQG